MADVLHSPSLAELDQGFPQLCEARLDRLVPLLKEHRAMLCTAESCTGGWIAKVCTDLAGSSEWFDCGFLTYSNAAKQRMLGVSADSLARFGAVSDQVAREMALGALANSQAGIAVSVTGIAGPGGGSTEKPVGLVYHAMAHKTTDSGDVGGQEPSCYSLRWEFSGNRQQVRQATVIAVMDHLIQRLSS